MKNWWIFVRTMPTTLFPPKASSPPLPSLRGGFSFDEIKSAVVGRVKQGVTADPDITSFNNFYLSRREEELKKADGAGHLIRQIDESFSPAMSVNVVGVEGSLYAVFELEVTYRSAKGATELCVFKASSWGEILQAPPVAKCAFSDEIFPEACLGICDVSGIRVAKHHLGVSELSGRLALEEYMEKCASSNRLLLKSEMDTSDVSGLRVGVDLLVRSEMGTGKGLQGEMIQCAFTKGWFLPDETRKSGVSAKSYRKDQEVWGGEHKVVGHRLEFVKCTYSDEWFLPHEIESSAVTKRSAARCQMEASSKASHRLGHVSELRICQVTGAQFLSDEVDTCSVTGQLVDSELLSRSAFSGKLALKTELVACERSGVPLLPSEIMTCEASGARVNPNLITKSDVSGKSVLAELLISSAESELKGTAKEVVNCQWDGKVRVPGEMGTCKVTGFKVSKQYLAETGELKLLISYAKDPEGANNFPEFKDSAVLKQYSQKLSSLRYLREINGPDGSTRLLVGETRGVMGLGRKLEVFQLQDDELLSLGRFKRT
jgi:hypothetical protein